MRQALHEDQLAEVLVLGNQDPILPVGEGKDVLICGARSETPGGDNVVPVLGQGGFQTP